MYDPQHQQTTRFAFVKVKASGMDCTRSLRPERPTSLLTLRSIRVLVRFRQKVSYVRRMRYTGMYIEYALMIVFAAVSTGPKRDD